MFARNKFIWLRKVHGRLYDLKVERKQHKKELELIKTGRKLSLLKKRENQLVEETYPIDFVVAWVDGSDPVWQEEKRSYESAYNNGQGAVEARFREWSNFKYWFRAVEAYAPWVRTVWLVTCGQVPVWIDKNCPKLHIISHKEFIPEEYLPTFSSHTIELNLWRIQGLSEHFIYFNDDVFLGKPVSKSDFFSDGLPKYSVSARPLVVDEPVSEFYHAQLNNAGIINSNFNIRECIVSNLDKWFSYQYSKEDIDYNIRTYREGYFTGNFFTHLGVPFRKSTMKRVYDRIPQHFDQTCRNRFRTSDDIMHQIFSLWEIVEGSFEPVSKWYYGIWYNLRVDNVDKVCQDLQKEDKIMICLNDNERVGLDDFLYIKDKIVESLEMKFSNKSSFEL